MIKPTLQVIAPILSQQLNKDVADINLTSNIASDLGADSLDIAEIAMVVKDKFDCDLSDSAIQNVKTVKDLCDAIESELVKKVK